MIGIGVFIIILVVGGFFVFSKKDSSYQNPQTLDELKQAKSEGKSEFDKCMSEIDENDKKIRDCTLEKLKEKGYTDGVDCIMEFDNPVCGDAEYEICIRKKLEEKGYIDEVDCIFDFTNPICTADRYNAQINSENDCSSKKGARYNAEVDASNECMDEHPSELTLIDCMNLVGK